MSVTGAYRRIRGQVDNPDGEPTRFPREDLEKYPGLMFLPRRRSTRADVVYWFAALLFAVPFLLWFVLPTYRSHDLSALLPSVLGGGMAGVQRAFARRDATRWKRDHPGEELPS